MRSSEIYQIALIASGAVATALFGVFLYREVFPEYKIYQEDYVALEKFRSTYTHETPPDFKIDVKQIVIEREDKGPPVIDRCISCHVALDLQHFSPTKIAKDINGQMILNDQGNPVHVPNEDYIWLKLDQEIERLTDSKVNAQLNQEGKSSEVKERLKLAESYKKLKTATVGDHTYDVSKVLQMHPLMGKETRPFEYHPVDQYGCVSCHNGNGRGLTTEKAHGPVFDGEYEVENVGPKPVFTEKDPANDPEFAHIFNSKPGHELLFQTTPIFVGALMEAKCMQCHLSSKSALESTLSSAGLITEHKERDIAAVQKTFQNEKNNVLGLLLIRESIATKGISQTILDWKSKAQDYTLPPDELARINAQSQYLTKLAKEFPKDNERVLNLIDAQLNTSTGSPELTQKLITAFQSKKEASPDEFITAFIHDNKGDGDLFKKAAAWAVQEQIAEHLSDTQSSLSEALRNKNLQASLKSDIDELTQHYHQGEELFISQACYACHRISGLARGGVGPELTKIGNNYPWYIKESIVWPQADLPSSTMPNYHLDHTELEDLVTFLLGQKGENKALSGAAYQTMVQNWEAGKKQPWETQVNPAQIHDLNYGMTVFATQGCAACHRLQGFESDVGFTIEKQEKKPDFATLYKERQWFEKLFPESILGSEIVAVIDKNSKEIDSHISANVRQGSILEQIDKEYPNIIEAYYSNFRFASRAKNAHYQQLIDAEKDSVKKQALVQEHQQWQERVQRILFMYIQEYGLGRLIGPRPNWSGIYRSDEWLMEHFRNPSSLVARSIMPVFPFDDTKFLALTYMLDTLAVKNRNAVRSIWEINGFSPQIAYNLHCAQCHGAFLQGNGPVAEWIYPIPKNLTNAEFLRNLTKERVIQSITHGVKGTPMPPWGEIGGNKPGINDIPELTKQEIAELANWIFDSLSGGQVIKESEDVPKWQYGPEDVIHELKKEGNTLPEEQSTPTEQPKVSYRNKHKDFDIAMADAQESNKLNSEANEIFDVRSSPVPGPDTQGYYIKKKYYTTENIDKGRAFFELNCAACHGKEGDGSGIRSEVMLDAKPRALTNLDWIKTRDDLRLIRSIKYGVPGTAMTPWGDFTSSLQRLQLVIFIRSLSEDTEQRADLRDALYETFQKEQIAVENARIQEYQKLEKLQQTYALAKSKTKEATVEGAAKAYEQELTAASDLKKQQEIDTIYSTIKANLKQEADLYQAIGMSLLNAKIGDDGDEVLVKLIRLNGNRFKYENNKLTLQQAPEKEIADLKNSLLKSIDNKMTGLQKDSAELHSLQKLQHDIISNIEQAIRLQQQEEQLFKQLNKNE